ncbi:nuclear receptor-binding protein-like isoform X1 [Branchiostoma lanceolatum]|uniref:nuclear receptor-binding protein-like isoform X1 n=1 Tax=Branchiostoma lanceolatum TaxID=7740 RepID=UPI00345356DA
MPTSSQADSIKGSESPHNSGEEDTEDEEESEVLEDSPCGRWQKRREEVKQRDVPGIDAAFLAMDTEEGVEVVWNEVQFSERKSFKVQEDKIRAVFDNLIQLEHCNIVKFHKYWTDGKTDKPRIIFITEYMSSGSLKQFLNKTKKNHKSMNLKAWKRWCTQILSALSYLHSCDPPIIHGNLNCDTIFIQHNGLIKIGSVAPDAIHNHVKTYREEQRHMHFIAPEYGGKASVNTAVDIYSFGVCALEMAVLEIQPNGEGTFVSKEAIEKAIEKVEDPKQKDFIVKCLTEDPVKRPTARELLFHHVLFEVHSLKLLAAHNFVNKQRILPDNIDELVFGEQDKVLASIHHADGRPSCQLRLCDVPALELEKFLEDVKNGIYPLTAFAMPHPQVSKPRPVSPEVAESEKSATPEPVEMENRRVKKMSCDVKGPEEGQDALSLTIRIRFEDKMNRQLSCEFKPLEEPALLAAELVEYGFICEQDKEKIAKLIEDHIKQQQQPPPPQVSPPTGVTAIVTTATATVTTSA